MSSIFYKETEFFPIPGFSGYYISKDSQVYSQKFRIIRKPQHNLSNGYLELSLRQGTPSRDRRVGIHRLLGITFLPYEGDITKLVINHKNGIKTDNRLCNLEWVTYQQNAEHAGMMRLTSKCKPIVTVSCPTMEITEFPSIKACSRTIGVSKDVVSYNIWSPERAVTCGFLFFVYAEDEEKFFDWYGKNQSKNLTTYQRKTVLMRNVISGEVTVFRTLKDVATKLNVSPASVTSWLSKDNQPVLPGCVQLKLSTDPSPWRPVTDPYRELSEFTGTKVAVVTDESGGIKIYTSLVSCAKDNCITTTALSYRLKSKGETVFSDGKRYAYGKDIQYGPVSQ